MTETYVLQLLLKGEVRQFAKETTFDEAVAMYDELRGLGATEIRLGVREGDQIRELLTTGSIVTGALAEENE